ncbi:chemotaxis protein CheB [Actinomadura fibrosa]|uniref:histidine kinase n=1 Tax=Actinomadura fibrosa TaxID=111802 RepID=A0ABW2XJX7_9ACTN|nr:chemotaxis protein CheB [Actinomadura fibrosa]
MVQPSTGSGSAAQDGGGRGVEVVALVTSAGGLEALSAVLRVLPCDFPAAVVLTQHLGGQGSALVEILARRIALPVRWAREGGRVEPGTVTVCPPRSVLEVLPDRTYAVRPAEKVRAERPLDALLTSVGDSFGAASLAVVLTGMGSDGAAGAAAVRAAGGRVIAQSEDTAEQPSMPAAAVAAGAVDLVLPLLEIGPVLVDVALGRRLPLPRTEAEAIRATFGSEGVMAGQAAALDWSRTRLGPVSGWSPTLRSVVRLMMASPDPGYVLWGEDFLWFNNDRALPFLPGREAEVLGRPTRELFPEVFEQSRVIYDQVLAGASARHPQASYTYLVNGRMRQIWFNLTDVPIYEPDGTVGGILRTITDGTAEVLSARRLAVLDALASAPRAGGRRQALAEALEIMAGSADVVYAIAYLLDAQATGAGLVGAVGVEEGSPLAPRHVRLAPGAAWPLDQLTEPVTVDDLATRFPGHGVVADRPAPEIAVVHPLGDEADDRVVGALVFGVDPYLAFDEGYSGFLTLVADSVAARMADAHARQRERERRRRLKDLDRAKTEFFSNVSHEFRTPLTLMLGPLEELGRDSDGLSPEQRADVDLVRRNARRLLHLVGTMLDFSQIEAGRLRATFAPVDLAERTRDIVAQFESAARRAGVGLEADLARLPEPIWVDAEMWEKIVSNLISNALKFTLEGRIEVTLRALPNHAELAVRDTGVGIPKEELRHVFKRFHRVRGTRGRTHEGAGIGLALVDELVRRHHGRVRVASTVGEGTTFTVWIPSGRRPTALDAAPSADPPLQVAAAMAEEASNWGEAPAAELFADDVARHELGGNAPTARILVVDDSKDMRDYLARLLAPHWEPVTAADGAQALALAHRDPPDLVLTDVMMPGLDGFALLRELRGDPDLSGIPVVLVTARAGEESAIEGLLAGADDYIVKPFSARELVARVAGQLEVARVRRRSAELNAFRLGFSDALRALSDPVEIQRTACRRLVDQLDTDGAAFVELDGATGVVVGGGAHATTSLPDLAGTSSDVLSALFERALGRGERSVIVDAEDSSLTAGVRAAYAELGIGAQLVLPLPRNAGRSGVLTVHQKTSRRWTEEDVALAEEAAGRAWAEVERARAEAGLRESEQRMRMAIRATGIVTWEWVPAQDRITTSDNFADVYGFPALASAADGFALVLPEDAQQHLDKVRAVADRGGSYTSQFRIRRPDDGQIVWLEERAEATTGPDGTVERVIGVTLDITERKSRGPNRRPDDV